MTEPGGWDSTGPDGDARNFLVELASVLDREGDNLVLIGGMAYNIWCEPRYTRDLDFVIVAVEPTIRAIRQDLEERGFVCRRVQRDPENELTSFLQLADPSGRKIVEFQTAQTDLQDRVVQRGISIDPALPFRVATPEDLIVLKLIAGRSKDYTDIVNLSDIEGIDWAYIEHGCAEWDVTDRLTWLRELLSNRP